MNVRKSDNSVEEYSISKIQRGVCEAYASVGEECPSGLIESLAKNLYVYENIKTSEIRRQVEECLMSVNKKVAKEYIAKFEKIDANGKILRDKNDFITNYIHASNASTGSKYDPNANVSNKNIATLNAEIPKQGNIQFNRYNTSNKIASLFSKKLARQYIEDLESHIIYKNDESSFGINSPYCVAIQSYPFLTEGIKGLGGLSAAPKNLDSFCGMFVNLVFAVSSQFAGACLYKDQRIVVKIGDVTKSVKIKDFVESFGELDKNFENYQGEWEYKDISNENTFVAEDGKYVKIKKVFRRKYDKEIYHIKSREGFECFVSEDHRFKLYVHGSDFEIKANDLAVNDSVFVNRMNDESTDIDLIKSIETYENDDDYVYEIETETHWYNCGGFITHNCAIAGTFNMFDYYARKEWGDDYYLHDDRTAKIKYGRGEPIERITICKQIEQYFQQIVYSINQPASARGFQSAFTNFGYFDKPYFEGMYGSFVFPDGTKPQWESVSYLQKKFMKWLNKERTKCVLTFPVN